MWRLAPALWILAIISTPILPTDVGRELIIILLAGMLVVPRDRFHQQWLFIALAKIAVKIHVRSVLQAVLRCNTDLASRIPITNTATPLTFHTDVCRWKVLTLK